MFGVFEEIEIERNASSIKSTRSIYVTDECLHARRGGCHLTWRRCVYLGVKNCRGIPIKWHWSVLIFNFLSFSSRDVKRIRARLWSKKINRHTGTLCCAWMFTTWCRHWECVLCLWKKIIIKCKAKQEIASLITWKKINHLMILRKQSHAAIRKLKTN